MTRVEPLQTACTHKMAYLLIFATKPAKNAFKMPQKYIFDELSHTQKLSLHKNDYHTLCYNGIMTKKPLEPLQVELRHPDQPDLPLPTLLQQPLAEAIFTDETHPVSTSLSDEQQAQKLSQEQNTSATPTSATPPSNNQTMQTEYAEAQTSIATTSTTTSADSITAPTAVDQSQKLSRATTSADPATGTEKVSHAPADMTLMTPPKRKRGRPRKQKQPVPLLPDTTTASNYLNKSAIFYLRAYGNCTSVEQVKHRLNDPCYKTIAEQLALELLADAATGKKDALNRYWNIVSKTEKSTEIAPKTAKNSTLLDDILTSVEAEVFGAPEAEIIPPSTPETK